ncbi:hypothetical protein, variant 1 [Aphanomyces invadans]|uniref:Uncharacterized protein n=1 Tax=Aphanomyces invadans TaxID=157072 RepID=A0A024UAI6_9STRA|nr:hypothetical protein, variant 1 [Aphanomyces invadans]ETW03289.1 hypothetical protein, variant 1 [Aphanomyces invadans]|eukprot:XP_008867518.1 hypothetical protein, variant 1 [Aphanomyces invadans]
MDASTRVMVASAALQSRMSIPLARRDGTMHQYKLVDSTTMSKQQADRNRIIEEIEAKRASKRAAAKMVHPFESALSVHGNKPRFKPSGPRQPLHKFPSAPRWSNNDEDIPSDDDVDDSRVESHRRHHATKPDEKVYIQELENEIARLKQAPPASYQESVDEQVLQRLAEFKAAQQRDLAVVERLVKAKKAADAQIHHLQQKLQSTSPLSGHSSPQHRGKQDSVRPPTSSHMPQQHLRYSAQQHTSSRLQGNPTSKPATSFPRPTTLQVRADDDHHAYDNGEGDEAAPPPFDTGPRTASSIGEPPGLGDLNEPSTKPTAQSSNASQMHDPAPQREISRRPKSPSAWATRVTKAKSPTAGLASCASDNDHSSTNHRKGGFFEQKEKTKQEQLNQERLAQEKLARAHRAKPPKGLLANEAKLLERKQKRVEEILQEEEERCAPFKARDAPPATEFDPDLLEYLRKERVAARAADLLASSKLPSRLADAAAKAKPKASPTPRRVRIKAAPVPDFVMMQTEWKASLQRAKLKLNSTRVDAFSVTDPAKLAALQKKKQERLERQKLKDESARTAAEAERKRAYDKAMVAAKEPAQVVETEAQKLRTKAVQSKLKQRQLQEKAEERAQLKRMAKIKQLSKQVKAEVTNLEKQRRAEKGNFVVMFIDGCQHASSQHRGSSRTQKKRRKPKLKRTNGHFKRRSSAIKSALWGQSRRGQHSWSGSPSTRRRMRPSDKRWRRSCRMCLGRTSQRSKAC